MQHVYCWSGGKDSSATVALAHLNDEPRGTIIMAEVMFDKNISGELPEHMEWVYEHAIPLFEKWGFEVKVLHSEYTYMDCFNIINQGRRTPSRKGMRQGFPMSGKCIINGYCKMKPIRDYLDSLEDDHIQYVGIAADEPGRLLRQRRVKNKLSLLEKYGIREKDTYEICKPYGLISPMYQYSKRGGCWFCPNARDCQLRHVRDHHNDLWQRLYNLEQFEENLIGDIWNTRERVSIYEKELQFRQEDMCNEIPLR